MLDSANSGYECIGTVLGVGTARVHADEGVLYGNLGLVAEQASLAGSVGVSGLMIYAW